METSSIGTNHQSHRPTRAVQNEQDDSENSRRKKTQVAEENPSKEDSVDISEEAKRLFEIKKLDFSISPAAAEQIAELRERKTQIITSYVPLINTHVEGMTRDTLERDMVSMYNALKEKTENAEELMKNLESLLRAEPPAREIGVTYYGDTTIDELGTQAKQREAGKKLAEYIVQNYISDPDEAKTFMAAVNSIVQFSEERDEKRLEQWVELRKRMDERLAEDMARLDALGVERTSEDKIKARLEELGAESGGFSALYLDARQSLVIDGSSIKDWFAGLINNAKVSINGMSIEELMNFKNG